MRRLVFPALIVLALAAFVLLARHGATRSTTAGSLEAPAGEAATSNCGPVTDDDAKLVLGAPGDNSVRLVKRQYGNNCVFQVQGKALSFSVRPSFDPNAKNLAMETRSMLQRSGGKLVERSDIGPGTFQADVKGSKIFYVVKGERAIEISVQNAATGEVSDETGKDLETVARAVAKRL